jgi:hypothetical protein
MSEKNFCPNCGSENKPGAKFCEGCGNAFAISQDSTDTVEEQQDDYQQPVASSSGIIYADDGTRLVALIIDGLLFSVITGLIGWIFSVNWWFGLGLGGNIWDDSWPSLTAGLIYFFCMEAFNKGQTLGKMVMKIKTVNDTSLAAPNNKEALLHVIGKTFFIGIDVIIGLIMRDKFRSPIEKNQARFSQRFSHTSVIKV